MIYISRVYIYDFIIYKTIYLFLISVLHIFFIYCANKERIYKWNGLFAKVVVCEEIAVCDCLFLEKNRAYKLE